MARSGIKFKYTLTSKGKGFVKYVGIIDRPNWDIALNGMKELGTVTPHMLAKHTLLNESSLTQLLKKFRDRGLVDQERIPPVAEALEALVDQLKAEHPELDPPEVDTNPKA